MSRLKLDFAD